MSEPLSEQAWDELQNNLLATGAVPGLTSVTLPEGPDEPGNVIEIEFDFLASRYRLTIERVTDDRAGHLPGVQQGDHGAP